MLKLILKCFSTFDKLQSAWPVLTCCLTDGHRWVGCCWSHSLDLTMNFIMTTNHKERRCSHGAFTDTFVNFYISAQLSVDIRAESIHRLISVTYLSLPQISNLDSLVNRTFSGHQLLNIFICDVSYVIYEQPWMHHAELLEAGSSSCVRRADTQSDHRPTVRQNSTLEPIKKSCSRRKWS